jgi:parvulin-like peptidyl-prolyl isomerase
VRLQCLIFFLLLRFALGQAAQPAPNPAVAMPDKSISSAANQVNPVAPDDAVITINEFCPQSALSPAACKTVISRAQFEKLVNALEPGMPLPQRLKVAYNYARILQMAVAAEKRGLDKTPAFEEEMRYARMQLLSQDLTRALQDDANSVSDADVADYYEKNVSSFEQASLARIFVPRDKQPTMNRDEPESSEARREAMPSPGTIGNAQRKSGEEAMAALAVALHARAVNNEDPDKLQTEAYDAAGITGTNPNTRMENVRRSTLPPFHERVMDLKPGEVSEVISDPAGAHFIYKMIARKTLSLEEAKTEIHELIASQRYRASMAKFQGDAIFSDAYFNPSSEASRPRRGPHGKKKSAQNKKSGR